jgi:hypothetical protein
MTTKNENQEPRDKEARDQDQASGDKGKGTIYCRTPACKNHLYGWTSSLDSRYCIDCLG